MATIAPILKVILSSSESTRFIMINTWANRSRKIKIKLVCLWLIVIK